MPGPAFADATDEVALGPAPLGDPHHGVWVDYSFLPDATSLENLVETPLSTKNVFIRTSKFPLERKQTCSILVLVLRCISALNHDPNTVD